MLASALLGQPALDMQDLTVTTIATGIQHAGDIEVDAQGNVWVIQIQGTVGGSGGRMTRISPTGTVTTNLGAPLSEMGQMIRAQDGFIYYWMNTGGGTTQFCQLFPNGAIVTISTYVGRVALGIAQDSQGRFYMGTKVGSSFTGVLQRNSINGVLTTYSSGIPGNDHRYLKMDPLDNLYGSNQQSIYSLPQGGAAAVRYTANGLGGAGFLNGFDLGYFADQFTAVERTIGGTNPNNNRLISVTPEGYSTRIADLGAIIGGGPAVVCRDLAGTGYYVLAQGTLYHITGAPGILTVGSPAFGQIQARVDHIGSAPFILAADSPGINLMIPGFGDFATSLGTGPGWFLLLDGLGAFAGADPFATCPWTFTVNNPSPAGLTLTLQAYILDVAANNGLILITNAVNVNI
ncbi:MAG: hypothetical protein CMJ83_03715 [Planctomycetes bacterium]|nr:hypothetical protein [Planctomycetota bacterium]